MSAALEVQHLRKTYGDTVAVDDLSFTVNAGEIFGLIGPNGAGKTTAVECATGLRTPDAGRVRLLGMDPHARPRDVRRRLGLQLQEAALPQRLTVAEALDLFASFYPSAPARSGWLERWGLAEQRTTAYADLSGGQKQRLALALALVHDPDVVVLDELSAGLDPRARMEAQQFVRDIGAAGTTVILVTHFMDEAEALCDRVALLDEGRLLALDTPGALTQQLDADVRVRFTTPDAFDPAMLTTLDGVASVQQHHGRVTVYGHDALLSVVTDVLDAHGTRPADLRATPTSLDDVFLHQTGRSRQPV
jgi:ABC-2 type transport system ATP-binding protein